MTRDRMAMGVDERAEAYLDGDLPPAEAAAFERDLAGRPEVAKALAEAIVLRDLLAALPPLEPPPGLEERIARALDLEAGAGRPVARESRPAGSPSAVSTLRAALSGTSWLVRPSATVMTGGAGGARPVAHGFAQLKWVLGPLATRRSEPEVAPRPAWRRVAGGLGWLARLGRLGEPG